MHIPEYTQGTWTNHEPRRTRKLLLNRSEIDKLIGKTREGGLTLVPLPVYFSDGWAKVEIALAKGKKAYDKRQDLAKRDADREIARAGPARKGRMRTDPVAGRRVWIRDESGGRQALLWCSRRKALPGGDWFRLRTSTAGEASRGSRRRLENRRRKTISAILSAPLTSLSPPERVAELSAWERSGPDPASARSWPT